VKTNLYNLLRSLFLLRQGESGRSCYFNEIRSCTSRYGKSRGSAMEERYFRN